MVVSSFVGLLAPLCNICKWAVPFSILSPHLQLYDVCRKMPFVLAGASGHTREARARPDTS